jgi:mono/diheme cytochrome c family protein
VKALLVLMLGFGLGACDDVSMTRQKKYATYAPSSVWSDGASARPLPAGTVARGDLALEEAAKDPPTATPDLLARGRQRYQIFCTPCHGPTGRGDGIVVKRGFPAPPPFDLARLRQAPAQHFFDVISDGYGLMYPFAPRVPPRDRWAIVAYVRALQLAEMAPVAAVPEAAEKLQ